MTRPDFETVYNTLFKKVFGLSYRLTGNRSSAEDLTQEVFMRIYKGLDRFRQEASLATWAYRITVNTFLDKRRRIRLKEVLYSTFDLFRFRHTKAADPERETMSRISDKNVRRFLRILPATERIIFTLHVLEGLSYHEISDITGKGRGAVKTAMYRARKTLLKKFEMQEETGEVRHEL